MRIKFFFSILLMAVITAPLQSQEKTKLKAVVVTATRVPTVFLETPRTMTVLDKDEIDNLPVNNVQELLSYALGADLMQRGPFGVQADIRLRGASFEQTQILINGVKVNDAQTGHHNLSLPLNLSDIERIEILRGPAASIYGANAVGGVVNIITRLQESKGAEFRSRFGQYNLADGELRLGLPVGGFKQQLTLSQKKSNGYRHNTDFDIRTISYGVKLPVGNQSLSLFAGQTDKKFGANGFYTSRFPDQWEHTKTSFVAIRSNVQSHGFAVSSQLGWRRNIDDFLLNRNDPDFYHNHHVTDNLFAEIQGSLTSILGTTVFGSEFNGNTIESNNLGNHHRNSLGLFIQQTFSFGARLRVTPGIYTYWYSDWGWRGWPGLNAGFAITPNVYVYGTANKAFRVPTFTELYYHSPANVGNADLHPEESLSLEFGLKWRRTGWEANISVFTRNGSNLIDWVRLTQENVWYCQNFTEITTKGAEISLWLYPRQFIDSLPLTRVNLGYAYIESDQKAKNFVSKYVLDYLHHQLLAGLELQWAPFLRQTVQLRYKERIGQKGTFLLDSKITLPISGIGFFLEGTNLLDVEYFDIGSVPLPGRWFRIGFNIKSY